MRKKTIYGNKNESVILNSISSIFNFRNYVYLKDVLKIR